MITQSHPALLALLRITTFAMFASRAYMYIFFDPHYSEFFWNDDIAAPIVHALGMTWSEYITSKSANAFYKTFVDINGLLILGAGICALLANEQRRWARRGVIAGLILLLPYVWTHFFGHPYHVFSLLEFAGQLGAPLLFLYALRPNVDWNRFFLALRIAVATTFIAHGVYAYGVKPVPQKFIAMVIKGCNNHIGGWLGLSIHNAQAKVILKWAGLLDFIAGALLFLPELVQRLSAKTRHIVWRTMQAAALYMVLWGFLTAFARIYTNFQFYDAIGRLHQWGFQFFVRTAHYSLPLAIYLVSTTVKKSTIHK